MKRFIITSPKYQGPAELLYNEEGTLIKFDLSQTNMSSVQVSNLKTMVPAVDGQLSEAFANTSVTIVAAEFEITFDIFYGEYPLKRNAFRVRNAFDKLNKTDQVKAYMSLTAYKKYLSRAKWQTPMIGDRYLKEREFETEWNKI